MNAAWAHVTGPFYVPGPDEQPNAFAAFMSAFLSTKTPWAMKLWETRLQALDPYARYAALAQLADIQAKYDDMVAANWRTSAQTGAMDRASTSTVLTELVRYAIAQMDNSTKAGIANQATALEQLKLMTPATAAGQTVARGAANAMALTLRQWSQRNTPIETMQKQFANNLMAVRRALEQIPDPVERFAAAQQIARELSSAREMFGGAADGVAMGAFIEDQLRQGFGEPLTPQGVPGAGGGYPLDVDQLYQNANQLLGLPGALPSRSLPASSSPVPPASLSPVAARTPQGGVGPSGTGPASSPMQLPAAGAGVSFRTAGTLPSAEGNEALVAARNELQNLDPFEKLGRFGQPIPVDPRYLRAYMAAHPEQYGPTPTQPSAPSPPVPAPVSTPPVVGPPAPTFLQRQATEHNAQLEDARRAAEIAGTLRTNAPPSAPVPAPAPVPTPEPLRTMVPPAPAPKPKPKPKPTPPTSAPNEAERAEASKYLIGLAKEATARGAYAEAEELFRQAEQTMAP